MRWPRPAGISKISSAISQTVVSKAFGSSSCPLTAPGSHVYQSTCYHMCKDPARVCYFWLHVSQSAEQGTRRYLIQPYSSHPITITAYVALDLNQAAGTGALQDFVFELRGDLSWPCVLAPGPLALSSVNPHLVLQKYLYSLCLSASVACLQKLNALFLCQKSY